MPLNIIFQDDDLIVVNKPANLLCVPGLSEPDNLFDQVRSEFPNARVVHRLDMATSGLVLFPLNHATQKHLGRQFETRQVRKVYRALVEGLVEDKMGEITSSLICDWERRPMQKIDWLNGKFAQSRFERLNTNTQTQHSELLLYPSTGRTHQLRLHCLQIGHPILGDRLYQQGAENYKRMHLHAEQLEIIHPKSEAVMPLFCNANFE